MLAASLGNTGPGPPAMQAILARASSESMARRIGRARAAGLVAAQRLEVARSNDRSRAMTSSGLELFVFRRRGRRRRARVGLAAARRPPGRRSDRAQPGVARVGGSDTRARRQELLHLALER